ncbi:6-bladed beta-propeller [bacterium]|nr:6-bladed beta-propeller [bacterium]
MNLKLWISLISLIFLVNCAQERVRDKQLVFPPDLNQPFLILEGDLGAEDTSEKGFVKRLISKITGPRSLIAPSRPVAIAVNQTGDVYVVDSDASSVLFYENKNGVLQRAMSMGVGILSNPISIAIHDNTIFVSDGSDGSIHKFDRDFKLLNTIQISEISHPAQIRINTKTGDLYILDTPGHQILVTNQDGEFKARLNNASLGKQLLIAPIDLAFTAEGNIVVLDALTRKVEIFSADFRHLSGFGDYDRVPGSFSYPRGLAVSSDGHLFITDAVFGSVQIFDTKGALLYFWGEIGTGAGQFLMPSAISFDSNNNLYIVDQYNNRVQIYHYMALGG